MHMSDSAYGTGTTSPMPQQPKFKDCVLIKALESQRLRVGKREGSEHNLTTFHTWLCIVANGGIVSSLKQQLRGFFLDDPRPPLGDEPESASFHGSRITRHQSPLSQGDRSESGVTGDTLHAAGQ